jgi:hypothetical protein
MPGAATVFRCRNGEAADRGVQSSTVSRVGLVGWFVGQMTGRGGAVSFWGRRSTSPSATGCVTSPQADQSSEEVLAKDGAGADSKPASPCPVAVVQRPVPDRCHLGERTRNRWSANTSKGVRPSATTVGGTAMWTVLSCTNRQRSGSYTRVSATRSTRCRCRVRRRPAEPQPNHRYHPSPEFECLMRHEAREATLVASRAQELAVGVQTMLSRVRPLRTSGSGPELTQSVNAHECFPIFPVYKITSRASSVPLPRRRRCRTPPVRSSRRQIRKAMPSHGQVASCGTSAGILPEHDCYSVSTPSGSALLFEAAGMRRVLTA